MAATPFGDLSWGGSLTPFHPDLASVPAAVAGDREGDDATGELFPHKPMTATASAHESDVLSVPSNSEEEAFGAALPTQHDDPGGRIDSNVAVHSFSWTVSAEA